MESILSVIDEDCESAGSYSVGSDADSVITLQFARAENTSAAVTEKVLAATEDVLAIAKKLYSVIDDRYADEQLLQVPHIEGAGYTDGRGGYSGYNTDKVAAAKKQLSDLEKRLGIAKAQSVLAENRLKVARAQVQLFKDQVTWASDQLECALDK